MLEMVKYKHFWKAGMETLSDVLKDLEFVQKNLATVSDYYLKYNIHLDIAEAKGRMVKHFIGQYLRGQLSGDAFKAIVGELSEELVRERAKRADPVRWVVNDGTRFARNALLQGMPRVGTLLGSYSEA